MAHPLNRFALLTLGALSAPAVADSPSPGKVNDDCSQMICESGLSCVERQDGKKKCSSCDQSKLNSLTGAVAESCKEQESGWKPERNPEYQAALATDGRVLVDVWDPLIANAKKCKEARQSREGTCWDGGDSEHRAKIEDASRSVDNRSGEKARAIDYRRVYYGSKRDYDSYLSTFQSKCEKDVDFNNLNQKLDAINYEQGRGSKVSCSDLEKYGNDAERCFNAAKDLRRYGFLDSTSKFPVEYAKSYEAAEKMTAKARDLLKTVKDKSLCS